LRRAQLKIANRRIVERGVARNVIEGSVVLDAASSNRPAARSATVWLARSNTPPPNGGLSGAGNHTQNGGVNPSRNILGSYFPSWMVCALVGLAAALAARVALKAYLPKVGRDLNWVVHHGKPR